MLSDGGASIERIRELFHAVDARKWAELQRFFHEEIVYERPGYAAFVGFRRVAAFYEHERVVADGIHHLKTIIVDGQRGACMGSFVGRHRTGAAIDEAFADFYEFRDGLIVYRKSFFFRPAI